jgi:hypothetical protein
VAWWHGTNGSTAVLWKALGQRQVKAFARKRVLSLSSFASEVGRPELSNGIQKLHEALLALLDTRRTLKRRVARVAARMKPYGKGVALPGKLKDQVIALEKRLLRTELQIQNVLSGFDILEAGMANLPHADQGDGVDQEIDRLLAEIDEHGKFLKQNAKEAEAASKPPDPFEDLKDPQKTENAPEKK